MKVVCPNCGHEFDHRQVKGAGAHYGRDIAKLSPIHQRILMVLRAAEALSPESGVTKRYISKRLAEDNILLTGNSLSGRLSELAGRGEIRMAAAKVRVFDPRTMEFRWRRTPLWYIAEKPRGVGVV